MQSEPTLLRVLLTAKHWQRWATFEAQFRRAAMTLAEREGEPDLAKTVVSERQLERWYAGKVRTLPRPDACRVLEYMFGHPVAELLAPVSSPREASGGKPGFRPENAPRETVSPGDQSGTDLISELLDRLAGEAVEFGRRAETASVGVGTIGQLDDAVHRISREYLVAPPLPLIRRAAQVRSQVFGLLKEHQRLSYTRDLYVVAAKCCAFLSWAAGDLGQLGAAAAEGRTALILAEEAGHPGAKALAYCALSKTAYWDGHVARAASLAHEGYECCPPNTTRALLACQETDAQPVPQARDAITRARRAQEGATDDDDLAGLFSVGAVRLANYTVSFHLKAGEASAAAEAAARAVPQPGEQIGYGTWSQLHIGAAIADVQMRELDSAANRLAPVLGLPAGQRLATLTGRLSTLTPVLTAGIYRSDRTAAALVDQIRAYCDAGAVTLALPPGEDDE